MKNIPSGAYTIVAWHKTAGTFRKTVAISETTDAFVSFVLPYLEPGVHAHVAQR